MVQIDNWSKSRHYYQNIFFKKAKKWIKTSKNDQKRVKID